MSKEEEERKCSHCKYRGKVSTFPRTKNLGYKKKCVSCDTRDTTRRHTNTSDASKENNSTSASAQTSTRPPTTGVLSEMEWHEAAKMIRDHKGHAFEFKAVVHLDALLTEIQVTANDDTVSDPADHVTQPVESALMARQVAREIRNLTDY
ncbi:hypothetical protein CPB85DRAFT_1446814 [Mucidula mucida]|nr:hypothetical protein CPB85DRAFT_1446814 [Mucidula mucida]